MYQYTRFMDEGTEDQSGDLPKVPIRKVRERWSEPSLIPEPVLLSTGVHSCLTSDILHYSGSQLSHLYPDPSVFSKATGLFHSPLTPPIIQDSNRGHALTSPASNPLPLHNSPSAKPQS